MIFLLGVLVLHSVMNWDHHGDKEKNKQTLKQNN